MFNKAKINTLHIEKSQQFTTINLLPSLIVRKGCNSLKLDEILGGCKMMIIAPIP